jgi:lysozyme
MTINSRPPNSRRVGVAAILLAASTLVGIALNEGYEPVARPPVPGDVPTLGFGETKGVKAGERTTPTRALVTLLESAERHADGVRACINVPLHQYEFSAAVSLAYNIGVSAFCNSTVARRFNAGDYEGACEAFLMWNKFRGQVLRGLTLRRERERAQCEGRA